MKLLLLAPQPFYQDRGTPIAVDFLLQMLAERGVEVDLVTYHEGDDVDRPGVTHLRIPDLGLLRGVRPGFSLKKFLCDVLLFFRALPRAARGDYDAVHAVEEAAFMALVFKALFRLPYVYDMDSCLSEQLAGKYWIARVLRRGLEAVERLVFRHALAVLAVNESLERIARRGGARDVLVLRDSSLLRPDFGPGSEIEAPESRATGPRPARQGIPIVTYVGNLEDYQGIDLLLESFGRVLEAGAEARLVVVGGAPEDVDRYRRRAGGLGIARHVEFVGSRPVAELGEWLTDADILVSPRLRGTNTPMKIYSYLHSGRPVVATRIPAHTEILAPEIAVLAEPRPGPFADALLELLQDPLRRRELGRAGQRCYRERFGQQAARRTVDQLLERISSGA